jgi:hypothetical protein
MPGMIYLLDRHDDSLTDNDAEISLNAWSGTCTNETTCLAISVHDLTLHALVDSGSTHCFMVAHVAHHLTLQRTTKGDMKVWVTNGEQLP